MEKKPILDALTALRADKERKFSQSVDLVVTLKEIDLKKTEQQIDFFAQLPKAIEGKSIAVCALVGPELKDNAEQAADTVIEQSDFQKYQKDKKLAKALAEKHSFFIAQADIMGQVATTFGRILGPKGKMPNPKAGAVVPPKGDLAPLVEKLRRTARITAKNSPVLHCRVGTDKMADDAIAENVSNVYNQIIHHLPNEEGNVKAAYLKLTMSKPVKLK